MIKNLFIVIFLAFSFALSSCAHKYQKENGPCSSQAECKGTGAGPCDGKCPKGDMKDCKDGKCPKHDMHHCKDGGCPKDGKKDCKDGKCPKDEKKTEPTDTKQESNK